MDDSSSEHTVDDDQQMTGINNNNLILGPSSSLFGQYNNHMESGINQVDPVVEAEKRLIQIKSEIESSYEEGPYAHNVEEFLQYPTWVRPKQEYLNAHYNEDDTVLTHAIRQQSTLAVVALLHGGADPNLTNRKGVTPMSVAAHKGNIDIMLALITYKANVNSLNNSGSTALIQASHFGNLDAVKILLKHGATADFANLKGTTALMRASQEGHTEISRLLIQSRADVNRKNHEGMNALMLASQRGHADMVLLLIRSGASMDEQTSQGSTALMLACKRGHEKCVEVLVTMGAEIFVRDCRGRTARDTATRRNHIGLLNWLDTQVQIQRMQEYHRRQRSYDLRKMREASIRNRLQLHPHEVQFVNVLESLHKNGRLLTHNHSSDIMGYDSVWPTVLKKRLPDYQDWQWSKVLFRAMSLPDGVFELIIEYLPMPRIWPWSLLRLRKRCRLAPHVAIQDSLQIADEILCDSNIFHSVNQSKLLIRINREVSIQPFLKEYWGMDDSLIEALSTWSDIQSLVSRASDLEVSFKPRMARNLLNIVIKLYKWFRNQTTSMKALENFDMASVKATEAGKLQLPLSSNENDMLEATDIGGEDASDDNLYHEPENEMVNEEDPGDDDYPGSDNDMNDLGSTQGIMPLLFFPSISG